MTNSDYTSPNAISARDAAQIDIGQWASEIESFIDETSMELAQISNAIENISPALIQQLAENRMGNPSMPQHTESAPQEESSTDRLASLREKLANRLQKD